MPLTQLNLLSGLERSHAPQVDAKQPETLTRDDIEADLGLLTPETWSDRHKIHKYWGRKPANVVSQYVSFFSKPGELVLDPFAGSFVTAIESARLGRNAVGFDFNPFSILLGSALTSPPDHRAFSRAAQAVIKAVEPQSSNAFATRCRNCSGEAVVRSFGWELERMYAVRYRCAHCGSSSETEPEEADFKRAEAQFIAPASTPDGPIYFGWEMQKLKRRGVARWKDLFTARNFAIAGRLREEIEKTSDTNVRAWLLLTLTASLAQFTRMIADFSGDAGGPSWKINCYWLPDRWQELNPLQYFSNRVRRSVKAITDLKSVGAPFTDLIRIFHQDSRSLPLADHSVDYIFTDPPYGGEGVQYGELSMLWCLWLGKEIQLKDEIAFNPYRDFDANHYASGLRDVFSEAYRVLKPGRWLTVTFANKSPGVWDALMSACKQAGFKLVTAAPMKRSAPSLTETNMRQAPKADLLLSFQKPIVHSPYAIQNSSTYEFEKRVKEIQRKLLVKGNVPSSQDVFDRITIDWFSWFYENGERPNAISPTLDAVEFVLSKSSRDPHSLK